MRLKHNNMPYSFIHSFRDFWEGSIMVYNLSLNLLYTSPTGFTPGLFYRCMQWCTPQHNMTKGMAATTVKAMRSMRYAYIIYASLERGCEADMKGIIFYVALPCNSQYGYMCNNLIARIIIIFIWYYLLKCFMIIIIELAIWWVSGVEIYAKIWLQIMLTRVRLNNLN